MSWSFEHSVEVSVPAEFAWQFWTNVANWALDADVVSVEIDGPFQTGTRGVTNSRSSGPIQWTLANVEPGRAVVAIEMPDARAEFVWKFEDLGGTTRITQHVSLSGAEAGKYAEGFGPALEAGIPAGMAKLASVMEERRAGQS